MSKNNYLVLGAAALLLSLAAPAFAQPMNHSGTNIPDGTDKNRNIDQNLPTTLQEPDTRDSLRKKEYYGGETTGSGYREGGRMLNERPLPRERR